MNLYGFARICLGQVWLVLLLMGGFMFSLSVNAEDITGKELVLKGSVSGTGRLNYISVTGNVVAGMQFWNDQLRIIDISDPASPVQAFSRTVPGNLTAIRSEGSQIYYSYGVSSPRQGWLAILDVTDPYAPTELCHYLTRDFATGLDLKTPDVVVVGDDDDGITVLDVSDRSNPAILDTFFQLNTHTVKIDGDLAVVHDGTTANYKMVLCDISDESAISRLGSVSIPEKMMDVAISGATVYLALHDAGVLIYDVSDTATPVLKNTIGGLVTGGVDVVGSTLYVASGQNLSIYDVTDLENPQLRYTNPTDSWARSVRVKGSYIYVGAENSLQVFNLQNVADIDVNPLALNYLEGGEYAVDVEQGGTATVRDFVISNLGESDLTISELNFEYGTHFSLDSPPELPAVIAGSESLTLHVMFDPIVDTRTLNLTDTLTIVSDDSDEGEVSITLTGDAVPVEVSSFIVE